MKDQSNLHCRLETGPIATHRGVAAPYQGLEMAECDNENPSNNPSSNPSNIPTSNPRHRSTLDPSITVVTNYYISLKIAECDNENDEGNECMVDTAKLEEDILNAFKEDEDVKILSTKIVGNKVEIQLSVQTDPVNVLKPDIVKDHIEKEVVQHGIFEEVFVEVEDENAVKSENKDNSLVIIIISICCLLCVLIIIYHCFARRKREHAVNQQETVKVQQLSEPETMEKNQCTVVQKGNVAKLSLKAEDHDVYEDMYGDHRATLHLQPQHNKVSKIGINQS